MSDTLDDCPKPGADHSSTKMVWVTPRLTSARMACGTENGQPGQDTEVVGTTVYKFGS